MMIITVPYLDLAGSSAAATIGEVVSAGLLAELINHIKDRIFFTDVGCYAFIIVPEGYIDKK